jgi:hypothetical protein
MKTITKFLLTFKENPTKPKKAMKRSTASLNQTREYVTGDIDFALSMFHEKRCDKSATSVRLYEVEVIEKKTLIRKSK